MRTTARAREESGLQSFEADAERFDRAVFGAYEAADDWRAGVRAAACAAARFVEVEPELLAIALDPRRRCEEREQRLVDLIDAGRGELADPGSIGRARAEVIFGGIRELLTATVLRGERRAPVAIVPELMFLVVRPYLGHAAAREELMLAPPAPLAA